MSLVEVICGPDTDEATVARSVQLVRQLRMTPVAINDCPGFVVNRLLAAMINQALQLYTEGYSIESIDEAVREFGFHSGPFQIIDIIGADTCMYAGRSMWKTDCAAFRCHQCCRGWSKRVGWDKKLDRGSTSTVSYTHLTLPTKA